MTKRRKESLEALADILNSQQGKQFDAVVAGHTDDLPIQKAATKAASSDELVSVGTQSDQRVNVMVNDGMEADTRQ